MKPTKNRYFCYDIARTKMLFSTEKKANTFMEFNSQKILKITGYAPIRAYYCASCGGWHVTSQESRYQINLFDNINYYDYQILEENPGVYGSVA